jgi:tetratricopeptide (TPR) repeat protein
MRSSIGHYQDAIAIDPLYARAWAGVADSWAALGQTKAVAPQEALPQAMAATLRALELDPELAEAHASLGFLRRFFEWDWEGSESAFRRALALSPGYATAHRWYGHLLSGLGRHDQAISELDQALELDPLSPILHTAAGDARFYARRYEEAMACYQRALAMDPQLLAGHSDIARAYEYLGRVDEAIAEYELAIDLASGLAEPSAGLANVYAVAGRRREALEVVATLERHRAERYVSPWALASIYARLGEIAPALDWLERGHLERDTTLVWLKVHPRFDPLRGEARFQALLASMGLD